MLFSLAAREVDMPRAQDVVQHLREAFARDPRFGTARIQVTWLDEATLAFAGQVPSLATKDAVADLARQLAPGCAIDNALTIAATRLPSDEALTQHAQEALVTLGLPRTVGVVVRGGVAHLQGTAPSLAARMEAVQRLSELPGIREVQADHLLLPRRQSLDVGEGVVVEGTLDDAGLANAVEAQLAELAGAVVTRVRRGTVRLYGFVGSEARRQEAEARAREVPGVVRVLNLLVTRAGSDRVDEFAALAVRAAIAEAGGGPDVRVLVVADTAYLYGSAPSLEAALAAERATQAAASIHHVYSQITVSGLLPPA